MRVAANRVYNGGAVFLMHFFNRMWKGAHVWFFFEQCYIIGIKAQLIRKVAGGLNMGNLILIVEDEKPIVDIIAFNLENEGYRVISASDGLDGYSRCINDSPDLVLLDVMLPGMDGFEICRKVRMSSAVPIIMLTAREDESDKVFGLELGADDYITKPFGMKELLARVRANMRRSPQIAPSADGEAPEKLSFGQFVIDSSLYEVRKSGVTIDLTLREYELLKFLALSSGKVFSREDLMDKVWGYEYFGDVRTVDVTVRRLREKVEDEPAEPKYILTKRGVGYYFTPGI